MKRKKLLLFSLIVLIVIIIGVQQIWFKSTSTNQIKLKQRKILYWVAPMNPSYRRDKPGKSPMGMELVPVYADGNATDQSTVKISPAVENNLGVKTMSVKRMNLSRIINTVGYVTVDENNIEHIHTYTDGWIRKLNVKTTGEIVKKGQLLLELYSPTLNNAQEELLLALKINNSTLIRAGIKKLETLGMSQQQISQLKKNRRVMEHVRIFATQGGIVSQLNVREGKFVKPDTDLMTIEDLSQIWMIAEVFERQAAWVKEGQTAIATLPYIPGKTWQGNVDYVYPELDSKTHTLRVRLKFPNPDLTLKPKMYVNIKILSQTIKNAIVIPRAALIRTGEGDRVILAMGDGRFKAQAVKIGIESGEYYQILSGLKLNDVVVTSAQFLLDSESNIKAGLSRIQSNEDAKKAKLSTNNTPQEFVGMGKVSKIDYAKRIITFHHQPMAALNMPAMTMMLKVDKNVHLNAVKVGSEIHFVIVKQPNNNYLVIKIHVMSKQK